MTGALPLRELSMQFSGITNVGKFYHKNGITTLVMTERQLSY